MSTQDANHAGQQHVSPKVNTTHKVGIIMDAWHNTKTTKIRYRGRDAFGAQHGPTDGNDPANPTEARPTAL